MTRKLIFTIGWMALGFVAAAVIGLVVAPLVPRAGITREHTPIAMAFVAIGFALLPWIGIAIPLILGVKGKLPGHEEPGVEVSTGTVLPGTFEKALSRRG